LQARKKEEFEVLTRRINSRTAHKSYRERSERFRERERDLERDLEREREREREAD